jgi:hypothetical protein
MSPMWFLPTASGFTIDRVRSIAMMGSVVGLKQETKNLRAYYTCL